jgi:hypothetical protein
MGLPKIDLPIFELKLPSTGEKIKYRQYTVKEEKILLIAQESKDPGAEIMAMKQVVNNCLIDIEITDLAMFDLEYVHLVLRSKSVENTMNFSIKDPDTDEDVKLTLDIDNVTVTRTEGHTKEIRLNEDYVLFLTYPTIDAFVKISEMSPLDPLVNYFVMISCLDQIASEDEIHKFEDYSSEEVDTFMETLSSDVVAKIQKFFETMPRLRHELKYTNSNNNEKAFVIEGLRTFFI